MSTWAEPRLYPGKAEYSRSLPAILEAPLETHLALCHSPHQHGSLDTLGLSLAASLSDNSLAASLAWVTLPVTSTARTVCRIIVVLKPSHHYKVLRLLREEVNDNLTYDIIDLRIYIFNKCANVTKQKF